MLLLPNQPSGDYDIQPTTSDDSSLRQLHQMSSVDKEEMLRLMQSQSSKSVNTEKSEVVVKDEYVSSPPAVVTTPKNKSSGIVTTAAATDHSTAKNKYISSDGDNDCGGTAETQEITRSDDGNCSNKKDVVADVADGNNINSKQRGESPGELHTTTSNLSHTSSLSASPTSEDHPALVVNNDAASDDVVLATRNNNDHHLEDGYAPPPPHGLIPYHRGPGASGAMMMPPPYPPPPHSHHHPHHLHPNPHSPYHHHHHHPSHTYYRPHQQRPLFPPPPHLQLYHHPEDIGADAMDEVPKGGDNDPSPSASTISTKASLAVVKGTTQLERSRTNTSSYPPPTPTRVSYHKNTHSKNDSSNNNDRSTSATRRLPSSSEEKEAEENGEDGRRTSSGSHSPSPHRMMYAHQLLSLSSDNNTESSQQKPKRPVHDNKKLRSEGVAVVAGNATTTTTIHEDRVLVQQKEVGRTNKPNPKRESSPTPPGLDGRLLTTTMAESPTAASAGGVSSQSQHSQQSLELGAMPSWETAGKPLGGWSVCSGNTFGGMESLKDGVFSSAFSFSESSLPNTKKKAGDSFGGVGLEKDEDDPSPKSILSKSGEKRKIAPGTHVQFTRDHHHHHGDAGVGLENSTSMGAEPRKRMRPSSVHHPGAYPPPPHHLHDEYYYGENPPRHAMYPPYDHYGGGSRHPPHPSSHHRHPPDQGHYMDDDPYYDQYYGPPPYAYPPHSRHPPSSSNRHPHPRAEYGPPHHPPPGGPGGGGGRGGTNIYTVHTPPPSSYRGHHHLTPMNSQYSHIRSIPSAIGGISASSWSKDDDNALMDLMRKIKSPKSWDPIAKKFERGKSAREIHDRWTRYLKPGSRKGQWTDEEDQVVVETVQNSMEDPFTRWSDLAQRLPGRVGKQVRDRWVNHLNPAINHLPFSREDDLLLWNGHNVAGKRWVEISSKYFKGTRSENHIKNRWYSASFKKFIAKEFGHDSYRLANDGVTPAEAQPESHPSMPVVQQSCRL